MPRRDEAFQITGVAESRKRDREIRTRNYLISMGIRTGCFLAALVIQGWVGLALLACAAILPYIAVVGANQVARPRYGVLPPLNLRDPSELPTSHPDHSPR